MTSRNPNPGATPAERRLCCLSLDQGFVCPSPVPTERGDVMAATHPILSGDVGQPSLIHITLGANRVPIRTLARSQVGSARGCVRQSPP